MISYEVYGYCSLSVNTIETLVIECISVDLMCIVDIL